jgi:hypothetical protein
MGAPAVAVPGTIFAVHAARCFLDGEKVEPDYDGLSGVLYRERQLRLMSQDVADKVAQCNRASLLKFWGKVDCSEFGAMGKAVEALSS